jgi:hypothetical protein
MEEYKVVGRSALGSFTHNAHGSLRLTPICYLITSGTIGYKAITTGTIGYKAITTGTIGYKAFSGKSRAKVQVEYGIIGIVLEHG